MPLHDDIDVEVAAKRLTGRWTTADLLTNKSLIIKYAQSTLRTAPPNQSIAFAGLALGAGVQANYDNPRYFRVGLADGALVFARPMHLSEPIAMASTTDATSAETRATADDTAVEAIVEDEGNPRAASTRSPRITPLSAPAKSALKLLVDEMQTAESWDTALLNYIWGGRSFHQTQTDLADIIWKGSVLARLIISKQAWGPMDQRVAENWAHDVFRWGGTRQRSPVTWQKIYGTIENALANSVVNLDGPMNSGYSKIASFATAYLDGASSHETKAQVINDSRVAASLTSRLDEILRTHFPGVSPKSMFPALGTLIGASNSGTRPRRLTLDWPDAYRSWWGQYGATQCVSMIRDILNDGPNDYPKMPGVGEESCDWTLRGVEAVLFRDGY